MNHQSNLWLQRLSAKANLIRNIGIVLFLLSFIVPSGDRSRFDILSGAFLLIYTPVIPFCWFTPLWDGPPINDDTGPPLRWYIGCSALVVSWIANFTVFFKLPPWMALIVIALPWVAYIFWFFIAAGFLPFYFWVLGITFIHISRILRSWGRTAKG
jgi:hypothetical protein